MELAITIGIICLIVVFGGAIIINSSSNRTIAEVEADDDEQITQITAWRLEKELKRKEKK